MSGDLFSRFAQALSDADAQIQLAESGASDPIEPVKLPGDELAHRQPIEWWYFTGHMEEQNGPRKFAFEMTAVRLGFERVEILDYAYFAFIEVSGRRYLSADRSSEVAYSADAGLFGFEFEAPIGQPGLWTVAAKPGPVPLYHLEAAFEVDGEQRGLRLELSAGTGGAGFAPGKSVVLHGHQGVVKFIGTEMGYYTRPRLQIKGGVKVDGELLEVSGTGWLDHEWGPPDFLNRQWKFFAIQKTTPPFEELIVYQVRTRDGSVPPDPAVGIYVDSGGNVVGAKKPPIISDDKATWGPGYPLNNRVQIELPTQSLDLLVVPAFPEQRRVPTGRPPVRLLTWWEGACSVVDSNGTYGRAFMELGGYE